MRQIAVVGIGSVNQLKTLLFGRNDHWSVWLTTDHLCCKKRQIAMGGIGSVNQLKLLFLAEMTTGQSDWFDAFCSENYQNDQWLVRLGSLAQTWRFGFFFCSKIDQSDQWSVILTSGHFCQNTVISNDWHFLCLSRRFWAFWSEND